MVKPTQETVAARSGVSGNQVTTEAGWNDLLGVPITVPAIAHDIYVLCYFVRYDNPDVSIAASVAFRIKDKDTNTYYPDSNGILAYIVGKEHVTVSGYATIPRNVQGHDITLEINAPAGLPLTARMTGWGHSPHKHQ